MTPELWQRLKPLFHAALQAGLQNRADFINNKVAIRWTSHSSASTIYCATTALAQ